MSNQYKRTALIFGEERMKKLFSAKVAVFGVGGVGGYAVEAFARSGIGEIDLYDNDKICITNINRQLHATTKNIGEYKVEAAKKRILEINPYTRVNCYKLFYTPETSEQVDLSRYDYVIDAIDTVSGKIELVVKTHSLSVPLISSMGAGNKIDPTAFKVADIYETSVCPLARVMRHELRKRGIPKLKVVYSEEKPCIPYNHDNYSNYDEYEETDTVETSEKHAVKRQIPGSNAFVPPVAGLIIAGEVIKDIAIL